MWTRRDYFPPHFLSLLFSLLNQTSENSIFHHIFLSFFSILPVFTPTKHTLKVRYLCNLLPTSSFLLSFLPKLGGQKNVGLEGLFFTPFSVFLVFSPKPNKRKFYFPPYFPLLFHPPCFHPNQTYPK